MGRRRIARHAGGRGKGAVPDEWSWIWLRTGVKFRPQNPAAVRNRQPASRRLAARNPYTQMKNIDLSFKIVVAVVLAGVVIAFASPGPASKATAAAPTKPAVAAHASADSTATSANSTE